MINISWRYRVMRMNLQGDLILLILLIFPTKIGSFVDFVLIRKEKGTSRVPLPSVMLFLFIVMVCVYFAAKGCFVLYFLPK